MQKYNNKSKKQFEKGQQTFKSFDKLYRKSSQYNVIEKKENESLCKFFTEFLDETKNEFFYIHEHETKIKFLSEKKVKFNLEPRS